MNAELKQHLLDGIKAGVDSWSGQQLNNLGISIPDGGIPSQLIDAFLQTNFDNAEDAKIKKIIVAAQLVGHATGVAPLKEISPISLAAVADQSAETAKIVFKVASNQLTIEEASDRMIDVAATRLIASTDVIIDSGVDLISTKLVPAICQAYPPFAPIAIATSTLLQKAKPAIKTFVKNAIPTIKEKVKVISHNLIEKGRKLISKLFA